MKSLLQRIAKKALASKMLDGADIIRLLDYNSRHPMWRLTADAKTLAAFDAIMAHVQRAA